MPSPEPHAPASDAPLPRLGKYELLARIGTGGMAEVHLARMRGPMNFEKLVVVKTIHPELASQEEFLKMLFDEARLSALIRHPAVVDIYELGRAEETFFIAMEYLEGQALSTVIAAGFAGLGIEACAAARIIADAAGGLHAAHELKTSSGTLFELVHRDVSPGNIMVLYDGNVKLVDFGVAKARGRLTQSAAHQLKGKIGYASPEQLSGGRVDRRSDIFSLGVVLWETLAHRRLFEGDELRSAVDRARGAELLPPSAYSPQVPPQLDEITLRALADRPEDRFQTAAEMKRALEDVVRALGTHNEREDIAHYMQRVFARRRDERNQALRRRPSVATTELDLTDAAHALAGFEPASVAAGHEGRAATGAGTAATTNGGRADSAGLQSGMLVAVRPRDPSGTMQVAPPAVRRRRVGLVVAAALVLGVAGTVVVRGRVGDGGPGTRAAEKPTPASAPTSAPAGPVAEAAPAALATATAVERPESPSPSPTPSLTPPAAPAPGRAGKSKSVDDLDREGAALFVKGKAAEAKQRFKEAIALDPRHAPSYRGLGLAYEKLGKRDRAAAAFEKYLRLSPEAPDAAAIRARLSKLKP